MLHIRDPSQLRGTEGRKIWRNRHRYDQLLLELEDLTPDDNAYWTSQLNPAYRACGCPGAALGLALGLGAYLVYLANTKGLTASGWPEIGLGLLALGIGSALGKLIGITWARARFTRSLRRITAVASDMSSASRIETRGDAHVQMHRVGR